MTAAPLPFSRLGRGPALMVLHGFTGSARGMATVAEPFAHDHEIVAPDLPGHGGSPVPGEPASYRFDDCVDDLVATLVASGHTQAHWMGYSMGARLALGCAVRHPDRVASLVLVAARAGIAEPAEREARRRADEELARHIEEGGLEAFVDEWMAQPVLATQRRLGPRFLAQARSERLANDAHGLAASLRALGPGAQPALFDALPRVTVPVLLVAGSLDRRFVAAARELAGRLPHGEFHEIADAGHAAHLEQPAAFRVVVQDFLRRAASPARNEQQVPVQESVT